jgi:hypothetical protein
MKKAFFVNGGAGRVLSSIPAFERYAETHDDFIIVSEGWPEMFSGHKTLQDKVFNVNHKNLFEDYLKDRELVTLEPYRLNHYFNQRCNLVQAFDILVNDLTEIPETKNITIELNKKEQIDGHNIVNEVRSVKNKEKVVVFQPFGSSATIQGSFVFDSSGRSFELADIYKLIDSLKQNYGVIIMSQLPLPSTCDLGIAWPQNVDLRTWMGIINAADYFLGCDSAGQHMAYALNKPTTVVLGSTFAENISYPNAKNFKIIDNGKGKRRYVPLRITANDLADRNNEDLMVLTSETFSEIMTSINSTLAPQTKNTVKLANPIKK